MNKNSMLYWWPLVRDLNIPMPETHIVELNMTYDEVFGVLDGEKSSADAWARQLPAIRKAVERVGVPAFVRTDHTSGKHDWDLTCYLEGSDDKSLKRAIVGLVECSSLADLDIEALIVRKYIPMLTGFTAFVREMPINPERRYFVRDGAVECHHPYWSAEAIEQGSRYLNLAENWEELLWEMNYEPDDEVELLSKYAVLVGACVKGYSSVDFCKAADGSWIFIDMAEGGRSEHPACSYGESDSDVE